MQVKNNTGYTYGTRVIIFNSVTRKFGTFKLYNLKRFKLNILAKFPRKAINYIHLPQIIGLRKISMKNEDAKSIIKSKRLKIA